MKVAVLSDIHGNMNALEAVLCSFESIDGVCFLGDMIDYGPHSNEAVTAVRSLDIPVFCNIRGNHEDAVINETYSRFSSDRGRQSAAYTRETISADTWDYIRNVMSPSGRAEFEVCGRKILAVHGNAGDEYWGTLKAGQELSGYKDYDLVLSGHSHIPHIFEEFFPVNDPARRNRKKTVFLNPGSVGQPRNLCPLAQYAVWDTDTDSFEMKRVPYDIKAEQAAFSGGTDEFYKSRLEAGV